MNVRTYHIKKMASATTINVIDKPNSTLNMAQLKVMIAALKQTSNPVLPTMHNDLLLRLAEYEIRGEQAMVTMEEVPTSEEEEQGGIDAERNSNVDWTIMNKTQEVY